MRRLACARPRSYALGITLLVALTSRSPLKLVHNYEEECEADFGDISAERVADSDAGWPLGVAHQIKELVLSAGRTCLCHPSSRKRLSVAEAHRTLKALARDVADGSAPVTDQGDAASAHSSAAERASGAAGPFYVPTPLSIQVRALRKANGTRAEGVKDNMLLAFGKLMARLDAAYADGAGGIPDSFEERINYWHRECGMAESLASKMHALRIWANAA